MNDDLTRYSKGLENISMHMSSHAPNSHQGSAREVIFSEGKVQVFRYCPTDVEAPSAAVLIVYALVNRPYILDIKPNRSFIKSIMDQGLAVYLVDWGYPDEAEQDHDLSSYISGYLDHCVDAVRSDLQQDKINLIGVCQGGTLSLCYTAMYQEKVSTLTLMVTPVDFEAGNNLLTRWVKYVDIDELVDVLGNVPGAYIDIALQSLKPLSNSINKHLKFIASMSDDTIAADTMDNFGLMERWLVDRPDQPAEFMRQFIKTFYQANKLMKGSLTVDDKPIELQNMNVPVHNIYATKDHIVPKESSQALESLLSSHTYTETGIAAGHIGVFVSGAALKIAPKTVADWVKKMNSALP